VSSGKEGEMQDASDDEPARTGGTGQGGFLGGAMMRTTGSAIQVFKWEEALWVFESTATVWEFGPTSASPSFGQLAVIGF